MNPRIPTLDTVRVENRVVLLRVDYNVSPERDDSLSDDFRIKATLPTLRLLKERKARTVILTHRGRPGGTVVPRLSTRPIAEKLEELLGSPVAWCPDCVGRVAQQAIAALPPGGILLLENTRFHLGEVLNQHAFVQELAALGEVFINDAFATMHRAHASVTGLTAAMPEVAFGPLMVKEIGWMEAFLDKKCRPKTVILGGAQVGQKFEMLAHLLPNIDHLLVGGVMANTLLAARDMGLGLSKIEPAFMEEARNLMTEAGVLGCRLQLPQDLVVTQQGHPPDSARTIAAHDVAPDDVVRDIGHATLNIWQHVIEKSRGVAWFGALGAYEEPAFLKATAALGEAIARCDPKDCTTLIAGDGLLRALAMAGIRDRLPRVSTAGAALIVALAGRPLPGLQVMEKRLEQAAGAC